MHIHEPSSKNSMISLEKVSQNLSRVDSKAHVKSNFQIQPINQPSEKDESESPAVIPRNHRTLDELAQTESNDLSPVRET